MIGYGFGLYRAMSKGWNSTLGVALIVIAGVDMVLVGFFPCDPSCVNVSPTGVGHAITATIASLAMTLGMLVVSLRMRRDGRWRSYWVFTLALAVVALRDGSDVD